MKSRFAKGLVPVELVNEAKDASAALSVLYEWYIITPHELLQAVNHIRVECLDLPSLEGADAIDVLNRRR